MDLFFVHKQRQRDHTTWRVCPDKTESKPCCYQKVAECSLATIDVLKGKLVRKPYKGVGNTHCKYGVIDM